MKYFISLCLALFLSSLSILNAKGKEQNDINPEDSAAISKLSQSTFVDIYPFHLLKRIFMYRKKMETGTSKDSISFYGQIYDGNNDEPADYSTADGFYIHTDTEIVGSGDRFYTWRKYDDINFPDSLKKEFKTRFIIYKRAFPKKKQAMQNLVESLKDFQQHAKHFPLFYGTIKKDFKGNIDAYVKHMFNQSILLDASKYQKFLRKPSSFKLANDPGVQFIVGLELYRLWLKQQQEEE